MINIELTEDEFDFLQYAMDGVLGNLSKGTQDRPFAQAIVDKLNEKLNSLAKQEDIIK